MNPKGFFKLRMSWSAYIDLPLVPISLISSQFRSDYPTSLAACKCRTRLGARSTPIRILIQSRKRHSSLSKKFIPVHNWLVPPPLILGIIGFPLILVFLSQVLRLSFPRWQSLILFGMFSLFLAGGIVIGIMVLQ